MCGICGIIYFDKERTVSEEVLHSLNLSLSHRGPDDEGYFLKNNIGLGHRRLSIIDLEKGHQPIYNEAQSLAVILNGEIYNFQELREELKGDHLFLTRTDTEVLVHGYEQWGMEGLLKRCNGMFAFCLYDCEKQLLFLARDRLGKKPLYYAQQKDSFFFSSEIRGLLSGGLIEKKINPPSLNHYIRMQFSYGEESLIHGIRRVLPAHYVCLNCKNGKKTSHPYWTLETKGKLKGRSFEDICDQLSFLIRDSVRLRKISDVPIGAFLSGGVDSSIITGLLAEMVSPLDTFSIGFENSEFDESPYSKATSSFYQTDHHHFLLTPRRLAELLSEIMMKLDEPVADAAIIPTYWLCKEARKTVTVVLTGEGGDELFAGYDYYKSFLNGRPKPLSRFTSFLKYLFYRQEFFNDYYGPPSELSGFPFSLSDVLQERLVHPDYWDPDSLRKYYLTCLRSYRASQATLLDQALMADIKSWLVDDLLMKVDKASMMNSLEARAPFLDYRLVEFALSIPDEYRIQNGVEKYILRESFREFLPSMIVDRKKHGFDLPMHLWIRRELLPLVQEYLSPSKIRENGFFNEEAVSELVDMHNRRGARFERLLFSVLMLQMWWESF
jgi:asparagine synthase (glutamine-hydrolysing)